MIIFVFVIKKYARLVKDCEQPSFQMKQEKVVLFLF